MLQMTAHVLGVGAGGDEHAPIMRCIFSARVKTRANFRYDRVVSTRCRRRQRRRRRIDYTPETRHANNARTNDSTRLSRSLRADRCDCADAAAVFNCCTVGGYDCISFRAKCDAHTHPPVLNAAHSYDSMFCLPDEMTDEID